MNTEVRNILKEQYGQATRRVTTGGSACCGMPSAPGDGCCDPITSNLSDLDHARGFLAGQDIDADAIAPQVEGRFMSSSIRAVKPAACCAPGCCV